MTLRVACVGAGPAGLYTALCIKRARPDWEVAVLERNAPDRTFGFGVVFSEPTLDRLREADSETYEGILARSQRWDPITIRIGEREVRCAGQGFSAIGRQTLLDMLAQRAAAAGVALRYEATVDAAALPDADVVVACDGARSAIRRRFEREIGPVVEVGATKYVWFGAARRFDSLTFLFEESEHGPFAVHAYPFDAERSTFIVETDEETWRRAGLDVDVSPDGGCAASIAYCERLFARHLRGARLLSNRSAWTNFRTLRTERWRVGRVVLAGDAAHTAHFSMGSGTKMALEDALVLARALTTMEVDAVLDAYEMERRPEVRKIQTAARPSLFWWEHFRHLLGHDVETFAFHFLTRNMRVTRDSLAKRDPQFVAAVTRHFAADAARAGGTTSTFACDVPIAVRGVELAGRTIARSAEDAARAALVLDGRSSTAHRAVVGVSVRPADVDALLEGARGAGFRWIDLLVADSAGLGALARLRARSPLPISAHLPAETARPEELVALALAAERAGADALHVGHRAHPRTVASAELLRFAGARALLMVPALDRGAAETLLLSRRADLCVWALEH